MKVCQGLVIDSYGAPGAMRKIIIALIRAHDLVIRAHGLVIRAHGLVIRAHELITLIRANQGLVIDSYGAPAVPCGK